ncbi:hypothetical protein GCM10027564_06590 [Luteimonas notoginsengisoli]
MSRPEICGLREFAALAGFKPSYITELKNAGRLVLTDDRKKVRVAESLALIDQTRDPARAGVAARHAAARAASAAQADEAAAQAGGAGEGDDAPPATYSDPVEASHARRKAKAIADKAEADARKALRDEQLELGQLLEADQVDFAVRGAVATFRTSLENLPNTLAPELAALSDEGRIRVVLGEALEHALEELSRKLGTIAKAEPA